MKVAVIGSRSLNVDIEKYMPKSARLIITGGARGIDSLAERYADLHGIPKKVLVPDYSKYGRSAPHVRNRAVVEEADMVIAIWDGVSRGTKYTINYAMKRNKPVAVYTEMC